jgi:hypothetical protein
VDQLNVAQVVVHWRSLGSTEINCPVSYESKNFLTSLTTVSFSFVSHKGVILLYIPSVHVLLSYRSSSFMKCNVMLVDELCALSQEKQALMSDPVSVPPLQVPPVSPFPHGLNVNWILIIILTAFVSRQWLSPTSYCVN